MHRQKYAKFKIVRRTHSMYGPVIAVHHLDSLPIDVCREIHTLAMRNVIRQLLRKTREVKNFLDFFSKTWKEHTLLWKDIHAGHSISTHTEMNQYSCYLGPNIQTIYYAVYEYCASSTVKKTPRYWSICLLGWTRDGCSGDGYNMFLYDKGITHNTSVGIKAFVYEKFGYNTNNRSVSYPIIRVVSRWKKD